MCNIFWDVLVILYSVACCVFVVVRLKSVQCYSDFVTYCVALFSYLTQKSAQKNPTSLCSGPFICSCSPGTECPQPQVCNKFQECRNDSLKEGPAKYYTCESANKKVDVQSHYVCHILTYQKRT